MQYSLIFISALATTILAMPTTQTRSLSRRAAVFNTTSYDDLSISGGVAGNCEAEALARFSALDLNNMADVDEADINFLDNVNGIANGAEKEAFNPAIAAATGDERAALEAGKTKNKCLKLMATKLKLQIQAAQGQNTSAKLTEELKKLDNNIKLDAGRAGNASTFLSFDANSDQTN